MPRMPFKETMQKPLSLLKRVGTGSASAYRSPTKHRWLEVNEFTFCFNTTSLIDKKEKQTADLTFGRQDHISQRLFINRYDK